MISYPVYKVVVQQNAGVRSDNTLAHKKHFMLTNNNLDYTQRIYMNELFHIGRPKKR